VFVLLSGAEILWRNAASSLNAEPLERYSVYAGIRPTDAAGIDALRQDIAARVRDGDRPRVEILGLKGPGRMPRWFSNSKIRSAIILCASTITNARSAPGRMPRISPCATILVLFAATTAISQHCSGSNIWFLTAL